MGLISSYKIYQVLGKCNCFVFEDNTGVFSSTNRGGFGAPNVEYDDVTKTEIYITGPDGTRYKLDRDYDPEAGPIQICTTDLVASPYTPATEEDENCGCGSDVSSPVYQNVPVDCNQAPVQDCGTTVKHGFKLADGCWTIEYYVWANSTSRKLCNYKITGLNLQADQKLWVVKNGTLVDVTADIEDGVWEVTQVTDIYTDYHIKNGTRIEFCGRPTVSACNLESGEDESEQLVSYKIKNEIFVCHTQKRLSDLAYKLNISEHGLTFLKDGITPEQANYLLALAFAKLDAIKNNPGCNCACVKQNLDQINNIITKIYSDCP